MSDTSEERGNQKP